MQDQDTQKSFRQNKKSSFSLLDMAQWSNIVNQWDKTKENQQAYCKRLNLNIHTFSYVRNKLKLKNKLDHKFIPVEIQSSPSSDISTFLIVENKYSGRRNSDN